MTRQLTAADLTALEREVGAALDAPRAEIRTGQPGQALASGFLDTVVLQVLIPILVSVIGTTLSEVLKGRLLGHLRADESRDIARSLHGHPIDTRRELTPESLDALRAQLLPLGYSDADIARVYAAIRRALGDR